MFFVSSASVVNLFDELLPEFYILRYIQKGVEQALLTYKGQNNSFNRAMEYIKVGTNLHLRQM